MAVTLAVFAESVAWLLRARIDAAIGVERVPMALGLTNPGTWREANLYRLRHHSPISSALVFRDEKIKAVSRVVEAAQDDAGYKGAKAKKVRAAIMRACRDGTLPVEAIERACESTILAEQHIIPDLGARKLHAPLEKARELSADDVDRWLADKAKTHSTRTLQEIRSILKRSIARAQARDKAKRNVVELCEVPQGKTGRPSKALTLGQAEAVLKAAEDDDSTIGSYVVVSLLTGARTEEMRPLRWPEVDLEGDPAGMASVPIPPHMMVWRSVRAGGDTKTKKSRRTIALPARCVKALRGQQERQEAARAARAAAGKPWHDPGLVFASAVGTELDASHVRRSFRRIVKAAGLNPKDWTPRELRHSFVSLLSDSGTPLESIARLCGHRSTTVTETIYRHQIRPVIEDGATVMDRIFPQVDGGSEEA